MADDITYRLRHAAWTAEEGSDVEHLNIAADEIERLLERVSELINRLHDVNIERLRALCNDLHHDATCTESFCRLCGEGIREWEARRG